MAHRAVGPLLVGAVLACAGPGFGSGARPAFASSPANARTLSAHGDTARPGEARAVRLLDVPFVPQGKDLCGGATLAMVLRFWGKRGVLAEDYRSLVRPGGIPLASLVQAAADSGWTALPFSGTPDQVRDHLARGQPVIALIRTRAGYHCVVVVGWANGTVLLHDPLRGPFRTVRERKFREQWDECGDWALLVLPPDPAHPSVAAKPEASHGETPPSSGTDPPSSSAPGSTGRIPAPSPCEALVDSGILLAHRGDEERAKRTFARAESLFPDCAAAPRERAGLRFRADDWGGAVRAAERAVALDPTDPYSWRLLAGSRFLQGDVEGALRAWNHLAEPRTDLTRIDGLVHTRYAIVAGQIGLSPGRLLTAEDWRRASRRLSVLPVQSDFRLSLRPEAGGTARVDVALLERPSFFDSPAEAAGAGLRAVFDREVAINLASPTGNGELWEAGWRWWRNRPRISLDLTVPSGGGRPGIWQVESFWERQTYAGLPGRAASDARGTIGVTDAAGVAGATDADGAARRVEERRRTALGFTDWVTSDLRLGVGASLDRWNARGSCLSLETAAETRWAADRLALGARLGRWVGLRSGLPFGAGGLFLTWNPGGLGRSEVWRADLALANAGREAPLALWSGAGTGSGRDPLLRAHPLLKDGVIRGPVFGRTLLSGSLERQVRAWDTGLFRLGWALFTDAARAWRLGFSGPSPWEVDAGTGLRLRVRGLRGQARIDLARGLADGNTAVSAAWQAP